MTKEGRSPTAVTPAAAARARRARPRQARCFDKRSARRHARSDRGWRLPESAPGRGSLSFSHRAHATNPFRHVFTGAGVGRADTSDKDAVRTCRIGKTGMAPIQTAKSNIGAMPHTVQSTNAGTVSHSLPASSTSAARRDGRQPSPFLSVCPLPHASADLQLLRSRPDLLHRNLRARSPPRQAKGSSAALSGNSTWSRHARRPKSPLPCERAMRDGSWSRQRTKNRSFSQIGGRRGLERTVVQQKVATTMALSSLPALGFGICAPFSASSST